ncbi:hypothetical protein QJS10_CPB22g00781 [Acorus calamus]|uniref:Uncharacterized protein n=1 Tax=Acorus calamus TaxID=4465 RepID=A0AAV9C1N1_ACOCL|nr:hypothetical protein QJS10_CPB22g00781 [Acorus calamus]
MVNDTMVQRINTMGKGKKLDTLNEKMIFNAAPSDHIAKRYIFFSLDSSGIFSDALRHQRKSTSVV